MSDNLKKKVNKSKIRPIDRGTKMDAVGQLTRLVRQVNSGEYGDVRCFVGAFITGYGDERKIYTATYGVARTEEQYLAARRLLLFLDERSGN